MEIIDTHSHLNDPRFQFDYEEVYKRSLENGVIAMLNIGTNERNCEFAIEFSRTHEASFAAVAVFPQNAGDATPELMARIENWLQDPLCIAVGETGLDYYYDRTPRDVQKKVFHDHCELALKYDLPLIVHDRDAHKDVLDVLRTYKSRGLRGVFHCYSGSAEMVREVMDVGFYVSFAGPLTFKNAVNLKEACKVVPADRILVETDCPYLSPEPVRGKRNEPHHVLHTAKVAADLRDEDFEAFVNRANENARALFGFKR